MKAARRTTRRLFLEELEGRVLLSATVLSSSTNWAGYAVTTPNGAVGAVSGSWVVPAVSGTGTAYSSSWVGIDGFNSSTVEQIGTDSDLSNGRAVYYAWFEMYPNPAYEVTALTIHAGDTMSASVTYAAGTGRFTLSLTDVTSGKSFATSQGGPQDARSSAEWITEAPSSFSGVLPLANFGTMNFTKAVATVAGATGPVDNASWANVQVNQINMASPSGALKATTSALTDAGSPANSGFGVTFVSSGTTSLPSRHGRGGREPDVTVAQQAAAAVASALPPRTAPASFSPATTAFAVPTPPPAPAVSPFVAPPSSALFVMPVGGNLADVGDLDGGNAVRPETPAPSDPNGAPGDRPAPTPAPLPAPGAARPGTMDATLRQRVQDACFAAGLWNPGIPAQAAHEFLSRAEEERPADDGAGVTVALALAASLGLVLRDEAHEEKKRRPGAAWR